MSRTGTWPCSSGSSRACARGWTRCHDAAVPTGCSYRGRSSATGSTPTRPRRGPGKRRRTRTTWRTRSSRTAPGSLADAAAVLGDRPGRRPIARSDERSRPRRGAAGPSHALESQTGCAVALQLGVAPDGERARVAAALAALVRAAEGRVATGFLGTPLVLPALSEFGHLDECYLMLLRRESPSWLYQVRQGGTTVWERWDAIRPDGSIHPGTMTTPQDLPDSGAATHAELQPLRLRRRGGLGLPARGGDRA